MKIAFYNHTSMISGAEISLLLTARHLKQAQPVLFAPEGELLDRARSLGLDVQPLPSYRARMTRNPLRLAVDLLGMLGAGWKLARQLRHSGAELVHANSIRAGIMAGSFRWLHRLPVVWHVRDLPPKGWMGRLIRWFASRSAQALIGISNPVLQEMKGQGREERYHLVHNGVELQHLGLEERQRLRVKVRHELGAANDVEVLAIIGQIAPWKRQEDAIEAFSTLVQEGRNAVLWIVGEAKFRPENERYLEQLQQRVQSLGLSSRVRFTGFRDDVLEICCGADLLLLCSKEEPFGRVVIEAMSQGTPVIGTYGGGVPEIIEHGQSGFMYETGNVPELIRYVRLTLDNPELWSRLSENGRQRAIDHFCITQTADKVEQVYHQLLHTASGKQLEHHPVKEMM
ncbi:glycosyltransferase family 4 protein [Paenibacillus sp. JSM ZJ436]|uniref:glycosyltransferase family 4 protein n=1 Tax=Paenibacillus sp. JSM ZJ436 TaxID=3376190 RepID=UPI0037991C16